MIRKNRIYFLSILLFVVLTVSSSYGDKGNAYFDWKSGKLVLEIEKTMPVEKYPFPKAKSLTVSDVEYMLPDLFVDSVMRLTVDSYHSLEELANMNAGIIKNIIDLSIEKRRETSWVSGDLKIYSARYVYAFYGFDGIVNIFEFPKSPYPIKRYLGFVPSREFSGYVIYAKGFLPSHGKEKKERLNPAFFIRIFDTDMNVIFEKEMCYPEYIKKWGMVAYTDSYTDNLNGSYLERVGVFPLKIKARGLYGKNATDLIISKEAARKILVLDKNIEKLKECRIVVIVDSDKLEETIPLTLPRP